MSTPGVTNSNITVATPVYNTNVMNKNITNAIPGMEDFFKQEVVRRPDNNLGKDAFFRLLMAQLQNQDPLEPKNDTEFISQLAQFSTLETMSNLQNSFSQNQAFSLIGKGIYAIVTEGGVTREFVGVVESAGIDKEGRAYVVIDNDKRIFMDDVQQVFDASKLMPDQGQLLQASTLIGKHVVAMMPGPGGVNQKVEGTVLDAIFDPGAGVSLLINTSKEQGVITYLRIPLEHVVQVGKTAEELEAIVNGKLPDWVQAIIDAIEAQKPPIVNVILPPATPPDESDPLDDDDDGEVPPVTQAPPSGDGVDGE